MSHFIKQLSGYSGCIISLYEENGALFVRKQSGSVEYNKRLERQIIKQSSFRHPVLRAPQVYRTGYINELFYADMEYIDGKTIAESIRDGEYDTAQKAITNVLTLFTSADTTLLNAVDVVGKVECMHVALQAFDTTEVCQQTLAQLDKHTWETHPFQCHGDLTLENMIIKDGKVYLIDFLDTFHDCIEADMSKLLQDLQCMWSFRHCPLNQEGVHFVHACAADVIELYPKITNSAIQQLCAMLQLTLLRIYPYIKDDETKIFLDKELQLLL